MTGRRMVWPIATHNPQTGLLWQLCSCGGTEIRHLQAKEHTIIPTKPEVPKTSPEDRLSRIAGAHKKDESPGGTTSGECVECGQPWGDNGCPTYVWATTDRDPLATWDPADDEPTEPACSAALLPTGDGPVEKCMVEGPHTRHVSKSGKRWTDNQEMHDD